MYTGTKGKQTKLFVNQVVSSRFGHTYGLTMCLMFWPQACGELIRPLATINSVELSRATAAEALANAWIIIVDRHRLTLVRAN